MWYQRFVAGDRDVKDKPCPGQTMQKVYTADCIQEAQEFLEADQGFQCEIEQKCMFQWARLTGS